MGAISSFAFKHTEFNGLFFNYFILIMCINGPVNPKLIYKTRYL